MPMRFPSLTRLREWRFLQLTVFIGIWMLLVPRLADRWLAQVLVQVILLNSVLLTLWTGREKKHKRRLTLAFWGLSLIASLVVLLPIASGYEEFLYKVEIAARVPVLIACAVGILVYVFGRGSVTLDGIFAAIAAYLLIAIAFAHVYLLLLASAPDSFRLPEPITESTDAALASSMVYFSFVTIATLGYGDVLPHTDVARMLAVIEAVVGQFYVAVIVALLVSKFVSPAASVIPAPTVDTRPSKHE